MQSSALALMMAHGEIEMCDFAIFADTQAEPRSVYKWLDWLETRLPFEVKRVTFGDPFTETAKERTSKKTGNNYMRADVPAYTSNGGTMWRQCTSRWKLEPIFKALKSYKTDGVNMILGISTDEAHRQKPAKFGWITNIYPLITSNLSRSDCLQWMENHNYPTPPRSACVFCPYHSDKEWNRLKTEEPEEFQRAVLFEKSLQQTAVKITRLDYKPFLHPSRKPLATVQFRDQDQPNLFGNECEGMCGV